MNNDVDSAWRSQPLRDMPAALRESLVGLRQRAVRLLSRRDYSRAELSSKLALQPMSARAGRRRSSKAADSPGREAVEPDFEGAATELPEASLPPLQARIDWVVDDLVNRAYVDDAKFAASLVRRQKQRHGMLRLARQLDAHAIAPELRDRLLNDLRDSELARAYALWSRRFGALAVDRREQARQGRYLTQRGFRAELAYKIVSGRVCPDDLNDA